MKKKRTVFLYVHIIAQKFLIALLFHLDTMSYHSLLQQKTSDSILQMVWKLTYMYKTYAAKCILTYDALGPIVTFSLLTLQKPRSVPLCLQNLIVVILFPMVAQCICCKNFRRFKTLQQDLFFNVASKITFHPFSCLCTGCPLMPA